MYRFFSETETGIGILKNVAQSDTKIRIHIDEFRN